MKTIMNKYNVSINHSKRVITIKGLTLGKCDATYRSLVMSDQELEAAEDWSESDIINYLRTSESYYKVK